MKQQFIITVKKQIMSTSNEEYMLCTILQTDYKQPIHTKNIKKMARKT